MRLGKIKSITLKALRAVLGPKFVNGRMAARNLAHYRQCGAVFVHVPKNAGSSISRALYGRSLGHKTAQEMMAYNPKLFQELDSFAVLRDPLERAISAW